MAFQGRPCNTDRSFLFGVAAAGWFLLFPPSAEAVEVGCFCTFVLFSFMVMVGVGLTVISKRVILNRLWPVSWKRIVLVTAIEIVLLLCVLIVFQTAFSNRLLVYLPLAFLLNYALGAGPHPAQALERSRGKRLTLAALLSIVLPAAVLVTVWVWLHLSNLVTFKEVRI